MAEAAHPSLPIPLLSSCNNVRTSLGVVVPTSLPAVRIVQPSRVRHNPRVPLNRYNSNSSQVRSNQHLLSLVNQDNHPLSAQHIPGLNADSSSHLLSSFRNKVLPPRPNLHHRRFLGMGIPYLQQQLLQENYSSLEVLYGRPSEMTSTCSPRGIFRRLCSRLPERFPRLESATQAHLLVVS